MYFTYVIGATIVLEFFYGKATTMLWESCNEGKLVHMVRVNVFSLLFYVRDISCN